jgi:hypothetical protein
MALICATALRDSSPHRELRMYRFEVAERSDGVAALAIDVPKRLSPDQIEALALATRGFEAEADEFEIGEGGCALRVGETVRQRRVESLRLASENVGSAARAEKGYPLRSATAKRSTIAAAGSTSVIAPTLWPAYIAIASTSPSMPRAARWSRNAVCRRQPPHPRLGARLTAGCRRPRSAYRCCCGAHDAATPASSG